MQNTTNDMTRGNSMKLIFQFFLPILIGNLFQQLYSFVDSMVVGKGIGDTALAAVGNTELRSFSDYRLCHRTDGWPWHLYFAFFWCKRYKKAAERDCHVGLYLPCHRNRDHNVQPASDAAAVYLSADARRI